MPRTTRNPEARERVVEAAWRVVAAEGVLGASMRKIAAEAGVTTGSVTHYFEDKEAVIAGVVAHNNLRSRARIDAAIGKSRGVVALESAVEAMLPVDAERRLEWQVGVASWGPTAPGEAAAKGLRAGWKALQGLLASLLEQAIEDGELPDGIDVRYEAGRLVALIAGVGMLAGVERPELIRQDAKRMLSDQIEALTGEEPIMERIER